MTYNLENSPLFTVIWLPGPEALKMFEYLDSIADGDRVARPTMTNLEIVGFSKREVVKGILHLVRLEVIKVHKTGRYIDVLDGYKVKGGSLGH